MRETVTAMRYGNKGRDLGIATVTLTVDKDTGTVYLLLDNDPNGMKRGAIASYTMPLTEWRKLGYLELGEK